MNNYAYQIENPTCWGVTNSGGGWGTSGGGGGWGTFAFSGKYSFDTTDFALNQVTNPCPSLLASPSSRGILNQDPLAPSNAGDAVSPRPNGYGLASQGAYLDLFDEISDSESTNFFSAGASLPDDYFVNNCWEVFAVPSVQAQFYQFTTGGNITSLAPDLVGLSNGVPVTNVLIAGVGDPNYTVSAWLRYHLVNGGSGIYGYIEQYFDKAYQMGTNGNVTTNQTGILSPYGYFFPTNVGTVALVTQTNIENGQSGTGVVYVIKLALDVNHDGIMDTSFAGPDNTSTNQPFQFWINNNFDRYTPDSDGVNYYDDDVQVADCPYTNAPTPDFEYRDFPVGNRIIPCVRDLQDFTRLWVAGVTTNMLTNLPSGSTITLSWGDVGNPNYNNPTIDLFQAADANGGIGYLTNSTIASNQIDSIVSPYLGRLGPGLSIQLNGSSQFANGWAGNYFIWCGVTNGTGALTLTIADGSGNTLGQTAANIQIVDIKQMYERWTVGDAPSLGPTNEAYLAAEDLPTPFHYALPTDTNTSYILYVHGWNMERWDKDRFAESAFKRLYWQGYQGRFGSFRWPTYYGFTGSTLDLLTDRRNYDNSEYNAWRSSGGLNALLTDLYIEYHSQVFLFAHSMGNVVAGEALRQESGLQIVNTYVASQAAVPAHTYDSSITNNIFALLSPVTPNIYTNWFAATSGAAGRRINFYNTNDFALQSVRWELNQVLKPDQSLTVFGASYSFEGTPYTGFQHYTPGSVDDGSPWLYFVKEQVNATNYLDLLGVLPNRWEAMAYAAQARSTALGRTAGITTMDNTLSLPTIWPLDATGHSYGDHFWHSAEFRGDCWQEWSYWHTMLSSQTQGFNISNQ